MATARQSYGASIELAFNYNGDRERINPRKIVYVMIESDYENNQTPIIYVSLSVDIALYGKILKYKNEATFYLSINKSNLNSRNSLNKNHIEGNFAYIPSNTNENYQKELETQESTSAQSSYKNILIGLISVELNNRLRKCFNSVYKDVDTETLLGIALNDTNYVVESPKYNTVYKQLLVPPLTSRYKFIDYIFSLDPFYDSRFRFFIDFDKTYLTSKDSVNTISSSNNIKDVIISIESLKDDAAYVDGITIKNDAYYIYENPANVNTSVNESTEKVANKIISVDDTKGVSEYSLNINNRVDSEDIPVFLRSENPLYEKNRLESSAINIEIIKQHIDGSIFTPDMNIHIKQFGEYAKYNGKYNILNKKEYYKAAGGGDFIVSCVATFQLINTDQANTSTTIKSTEHTSFVSSSSNIDNTSRLVTSADRARDL